MCVRDYLRFLRKDAGSLASSVLTRPNSCMTLSSCLRSSWPFSRNMNSWPLLPAEGAEQTQTIFRNPTAIRERAPARRARPQAARLLPRCFSVGGNQTAAVCGGNQRSDFTPFTINPHIMIVLSGNELFNNREQRKRDTPKGTQNTSAGKCVPPLSRGAQLRKCGLFT